MNYTTAMIQLPLVRETPKGRVATPDDVSRLCDDLRQLAQESFHVLVLNTRNQLINRHMVTLGLADAALVHSREVFRPAILDNAAALILVHNHPSGDATPSAEDLRVTRELVRAGEIVGIKVLDHIIIGRSEQASGAYYSLREGGLCEFKA